MSREYHIALNVKYGLDARMIPVAPWLQTPEQRRDDLLRSCNEWRDRALKAELLLQKERARRVGFVHMVQRALDELSEPRVREAMSFYGCDR